MHLTLNCGCFYLFIPQPNLISVGTGIPGRYALLTIGIGSYYVWGNTKMPNINRHGLRRPCCPFQWPFRLSACTCTNLVTKMRSGSVTIVLIFHGANKANWVSVSYATVCMIFFFFNKNIWLDLTLMPHLEKFVITIAVRSLGLCMLSRSTPATNTWKGPFKKDHQFDNFDVTGGTVSCHNDNLWCHQSRQSCQNGNFFNGVDIN